MFNLFRVARGIPSGGGARQRYNHRCRRSTKGRRASLFFAWGFLPRRVLVQRLPRSLRFPSQEVTDQVVMVPAAFEIHAVCCIGPVCGLPCLLVVLDFDLFVWFCFLICLPQLLVYIFLYLLFPGYFLFPPCVSILTRPRVFLLFYLYCFLSRALALLSVWPVSSFSFHFVCFIFVFVFLNYVLFSLVFQCTSVSGVCMLCLSYPVRWHDIALSNAFRCIISVS